MAVRGSVAKARAIEKIREAFGEDYITTENNKTYIWADDGGERVQIAISLTCPKNFVGAYEGIQITNDNVNTTEITDREKHNIELLMNRLGL